MRIQRREVGMWLLVTVVAVLIWIWAADETREERAIDSASVQFTVVGFDEWLVTPERQSLELLVEGPVSAIHAAETLLRHPLTIELRDVAGVQRVDLFAELIDHPALVESGVRILEVGPHVTDIEIDRFVTEMGGVALTTLPQGQTYDDLRANPPEVRISMPESARIRYPERLTVEPIVDPTEIASLEPGRPHSLIAPLRLRGVLGDIPGIRIEPPTATISFTVRSRLRDYTLDLVRVQVAGPHEDWDEFEVEIEPTTILDVTVNADVELIDRIEAGDIQQVFAIVYLSSAEKEAGVDRKPVTCLMAILPEGGALMLDLAEGQAPLPEIVFDIVRKSPGDGSGNSDAE